MSTHSFLTPWPLLTRADTKWAPRNLRPAIEWKWRASVRVNSYVSRYGKPVHSSLASVACGCAIVLPLGCSSLLLLYYDRRQSSYALKTLGIVSGLTSALTLAGAWLIWSGTLIDVPFPSIPVVAFISLIVG